MTFEREGPPLEALVRRLAETPGDFLREPLLDGTGGVHVAAVAGDLAVLLGGTPDDASLAPFSGGTAGKDRNRLAVALILAWLLSDEWFVEAGPDPARVLGLLREGSAELGAVASGKFVADPDRREEMARYALERLGFRPAGETRAQAADRLATVSSAERARVVAAARAAEKRARELREALARKAAQEAADKATRE